MSNILRPNFFGIQTASTPEWVVGTGMVAKVIDATGDQTIVVAQGGKLDLDGALGANLIQLQGLASSQVLVYRSGTEARFKLLGTGETFLSLPSTSTIQTLRFTDGDKALQIISGAPRFAGNTISPETSAPTLLSISVSGSELRLVFNEEISGGNLPLPSAFLISIEGIGLASTAFSVSSGEGDTVSISLPATAASASTVMVSYNDPTDGNDIRALQDINGNDVGGFGPLPAVRNPVDVRAPVLLAAATSADGGKIALEFSEDLPAGTLAASRFAVTAAGAPVNVASASASSKSVELTLAPGAIQSGQPVQLSYTGAVGSADALKDAAGNAVANFTDWSVANEVLGAAPVLLKATNILRPNFYGIETGQTPNWKVSAGMVAKVIDASGAQVITVARGGKLDLDGALGANVIVLEGRASGEVEVYRSGTEVRFRLQDSGETILSLPANTTDQTLRFVNGDKLLQISGGTPRFDGKVVNTDTAAPVFERATISGTDLRLIFGEELNGARLPPASALTVTVSGQALTTSQFTIQEVQGNQLIVMLKQAVALGTVVTVAYADPTPSNDDTAIQDINGNDATSFGPIRAVEPVKKIFLDDQIPAGGPGNVVSLSVASQAFHLVEDAARSSNFEISSFGFDDKIELTNLSSPGILSISSEQLNITLVLNFDSGISSQLTLLDVLPEGVIVYNPASFNELAVGDLIGVDATRPVFSDGASRTVSVVEGQAQLVTVSATDASGVSYSLEGADSALLQVSESGVVSLKAGILDFDAVNAKRSYTFNVVAIDAIGNDRVQSIMVSVTNDPEDDASPAPVLQSNLLDNVINLDPTSNIVLNYDIAVTAAPGKFIRIVNDGDSGPVDSANPVATGFRGENTNNTLVIAANDASQVSISGSRVIINPLADLDLANKYHIDIDAGAFTSATGLPTVAFNGTTALNFNTITPGRFDLSRAALSKKQNEQGTIVDSFKWLDIEGIGSPSSATGEPLDLLSNSIALVFKDYSARPSSAATGYDGIDSGSFNVSATGFGTDDLLYADSQNSEANDPVRTIIVSQGQPPSKLQFAPDTTSGSLGGFVAVTLVGNASTQTFSSINDWQSKLGSTSAPFISG